MRSESLLVMQPPSPVQSVGELYAIAFAQTQQAAQRYRGLAAAGTDKAFEAVRCVFAVLSQREAERLESIKQLCVARTGQVPDLADMRWTPVDLVPADELSDIKNSLLSTAYGAWALAVRHRERAFIFWSYVAAFAPNTAVRTAAEDMAREALQDGNLLRHERRLAWRAERKSPVGEAAARTELSSAALLESLLLKDIFRWSQDMPSLQRDRLLSLIGNDPERQGVAEADMSLPEPIDLEEVKRRALRRAEQLSSIYLDEAGGAADQSTLELAQQLAASSIARLAELRAIASPLA